MAIGTRTGSVTPRFLASVLLTPSAINPNSISIETYTVNGLATDMVVQVKQPVPDNNALRILSTRVSAANTLEISWLNLSSSTLTPAAAQEFQVVAN